MLSKSMSRAVERGLVAERSGPARRIRLGRLSRHDQESLGRVVGVFLLTRLLLYMTGALAARMAPSAWGHVPASLGKNFSLVPWTSWDSGWYLSIAERGYSFDPNAPSSVAFYPLFPLLIRGSVGALTGNYVVAGLLVANLAALGAVLTLWRWVRAEAGTAAAERSALWLLVYPFSFFLHAVYAESLFFLLATLALAASARDRRIAAGLWGALAAATRPLGVMLAPALAWGLWRDYRAGRRLGPGDVLAVLLPALGLGAYMTYLWVEVGDPVAVFSAHTVGWRVQPEWAIARYWEETSWILARLREVHTYEHLLEITRIVLPLLFAGLTVQVFRRLGAVPGIYAGLAVAVVVLFAPGSAGRELLAVTPAFAVMGMIGPRGVLGEPLRLFCLGLLVLFVLAFGSGHFLG